MRKNIWLYALSIPVCLFLALIVYHLPPVYDRLAWRVDEQVLRFKYWLNPPEEVVFVPGQQPEDVVASPTPAPSPTPQPSPTPTPVEPEITSTPPPSPTPTATPEPLPAQVSLQGVRYEDQHGRFNYCAPATLSMALSYWGYGGNRDTIGPVIKPDPKDKNVMPYEMETYVEEQAGLRAVTRIGGDLDVIKRFVAAGYPVLVEKGVYFRDIGGVVSWMGHYEVITGYDDEAGVLIGQDSYVGPDQRRPYDDFIRSWRAFNYTYLVIYDPEKEAEVLEILGPDADETANAQRAAQKASDEIFALTGIDQYFAWFNRGSSLVELQDYAGAAAAYDEAFLLYPSIPEKDRPWRMLWYQTGPYFAYFYSGRYYDVLSLAENTLATLQSEKNLEESYYWRAMAKAALGDTSGAVEDYRLSLQYHEDFPPALYQLQLLGYAP